MPALLLRVGAGASSFGLAGGCRRPLSWAPPPAHGHTLLLRARRRLAPCVRPADWLLPLPPGRVILAANGWLEDVSKVEKFVMSDEAYAARDNTYRKFKEASATGGQQRRKGTGEGWGRPVQAASRRRRRRAVRQRSAGAAHSPAAR